MIGADAFFIVYFRVFVKPVKKSEIRGPDV